mgnify:CR=1 FL=1
MNDPRTEEPRDDASGSKAPDPEGAERSAPAEPGPEAAEAPESSPLLGDTTAPPPPPPPRDPRPEAGRSERRGGGLALLALLVALAAAGGAGYLYWLQQQAQTARTAAAARAAETASELAELRAEEDALRRRLAALEDTQAERGRAVANLEQQVQRQVAAVRDRLESLAQVESGPQRAPSLAELEYLLLLADRELHLADNPRVALAALREADRRIARMDEPALAEVRAALNDEIAAVEAVAGTDPAGIAMRLASLADRIEGLPLRGSLAPPPADGAPGDETGASGWERFMARVRGAAAGLFRVRRSDAPAAPLLAPDESFFLYRNVELDLKSARLAVLAGDSANYAAGLASARAALLEYFEADDPAVAAVLTAVEELQQRDIEPQWPEISRSLALLRDVGTGN